MSRCHHILCRHIRLPRLMYKEVGLGAPCKGSNLWNFPPPGHNHPCPYHAQCSMFKAVHCNAPSHIHHCPHQGSALCHVAGCGTVVLCGSDNHWLSERNQRAKHSSQRMLISSLLQLWISDFTCLWSFQFQNVCPFVTRLGRYLVALVGCILDGALGGWLMVSRVCANDIELDLSVCPHHHTQHTVPSASAQCIT